jgi:hypothetical protein
MRSMRMDIMDMNTRISMSTATIITRITTSTEITPTLILAITARFAK